ncbi:MAG TPA: DUF998 domain-containing protein [Methylomirabilota bacterium]|nr:DUF998 domain-containing protein [Methylomirabilota bacterium]
MAKVTKSNNSLVLSYLDLRKAIGIIGMALPFVLVLGKVILEGPGLQSSISSYYYTIMRDVFVGSLCSIAVFLFSYRGYAQIDNMMGMLASLFAVGTALFPTDPSVNPTDLQILIGKFHITFALLFFLTLAFFALFLFRKTDPTKPPTPQKLMRNSVYTFCGWGIIVCILLIIIVEKLSRDLVLFDYVPVFWLEALAIILFGISWFVKGEAILKDEVSTK